MGPHWDHLQTLSCGFSSQGSEGVTWVQAQPKSLRAGPGQGPEEPQGSRLQPRITE